MGIFDNLTPPSSTSGRSIVPISGRGNGPASDRPKAKLWINIGYVQNGRFVNLPVGMPVDTMEALEIRGQNEDWAKFQTARNELLKALKTGGEQLAPGQETQLPLVVMLRRVNEDLQVDAEQNEYATDLTGLFGAVTQQQAAE